MNILKQVKGFEHLKMALAGSRDGNKAYVAGGAGLLILDTTNRSKPVNLGRCGEYGFDAEDITLSNDGKTAHITYSKRGVITVDISDPLNPREIGKSTTIPEDDTKVKFVGYRESDGLAILDISYPSKTR